MGLFNRKKATPAEPLPHPNQQPQAPRIIYCDERDYRRPCWVGDRKALFHRWAPSAHPVLPRGVQPSENARFFQFRNVKAIVEYQDGTVDQVYPTEIQFIDGGNFDDFTWPGENRGAQHGTE